MPITLALILQLHINKMNISNNNEIGGELSLDYRYIQKVRPNLFKEMKLWALVLFH